MAFSINEDQRLDIPKQEKKTQNNRTLTFINLTLYIKINSKWTIDLSIKNIK